MIPNVQLWLPKTVAGLLLLAVWYAVEWAAVRWRIANEGRRPGWVWLASPLALVAVAAVLVAGLIAGLFSAEDVGLMPFSWQAALPWLPGFVAGMALCIGLLWGGLWRRLAPQGIGREGAVAPLAKALRDEALLMVLRGVLAPLAGAYWGAWGAVALRTLAGWCFPAMRAPQSHVERANWWLSRALDVAATVVTIMTESVWAAVAARLLLVGVNGAIRAWMRHSYDNRRVDA